MSVRRSRIEESSVNELSLPFLSRCIAGRAAVAALALLTPLRFRVHGASCRSRRRCPTAPNPKPRQAERRPARRPAAGNVAAVDPANPAQQKSLTSKAIEKVKEVAKSAGDIFSRVPCLPPKGGAKSMGSLPHVASKLAAGEPVVIIAFGSSSTAGLWLDLAGIHLSQPARGAAAPAISDRRHHRDQSRQGRRRRARNDEAAADRGDRHEARIW